MIGTMSHWSRQAVRAGLVVGAVSLLAACAQQTAPPQQVRTENPSVTYRYLGDQELVNANQKAVVYCSQFQAAPSTRQISETPDGLKQVVFDCLPTTAPGMQPSSRYIPGTTYTYRTDQELLTASRNAELYCQNHGNQRAVTSIVTNTDGTKTLSARCQP